MNTILASVLVISTLCQASEPEVVFEQYLYRVRRLIGCGDGFADNLLWHLDRSDTANGVLDRVERRRLTGKGAVVYLFDSGVMRAHDEFTRPGGSNVIAGIDADHSSHCPVLEPCARSSHEAVIFGHGTAVASILGGRRTGVAPDVSIVAVRTVPDSDEIWAGALRSVIAHAYDPSTPPFKTAIVSMSFAPRLFGSPAFEELMRRMVDGVDSNGDPDPNGKRFLFVGLAGNLGPLHNGLLGHCTMDGDTALVPAAQAAAIDGVISVGGITRDNTEWSGGCHGPRVEVLAPAADMLVASNTGTDHYRYDPEWISGTSFATPYVAGMAARLLELDPSLTPQQLEQRLKASPSRVAGKPVPVIEVPIPKRRAAR